MNSSLWDVPAPPPKGSPTKGAAVDDSATVAVGSSGPVDATPAPRAGPGPAALPRVSGYEVFGVVGVGGMGVVYKARHRELNRVVALKMLGREWQTDDDSRERFRREAEAVARLQHPNIIQLFDIGTCDREAGGVGQPYMALEYVDGGNLLRFAGTPLDPRFAAGMVEKLARAAGAAHRVGVVHRDLKPANVLLTADGTPKIADFGLAKQLDPGPDEGGRYRTQAGIILGTPEYMAPEQVDGKPPTPAMDVYALGVILYELFTGRVPLKGASLTETLLMARLGEPVPPRQLQPTLPRDLDTICLKCLQKPPEKRYATADELADDLARWRDGTTILARPAGRVERATRWARRNPTAAGWMAAAVLTFVVGLSIILWKWREATANEDEAKRAAATAEQVAEQERWERYRANVRASSAMLDGDNGRASAAALADAPERHRGWEWHVLNGRLEERARVIPMPDAPYSSLVPGRAEFVTGGDRCVRWELAAPTAAAAVARPARGAGHWHPAEDGRDAAWVSRDTHGLLLVGLGASPAERELTGHTGHITGFRFTATTVTSSSRDGTVRVWDRATGQQKASRQHKRPTLVQAVSPDGGWVAFSEEGQDGLWLWDVSRNTVRRAGDGGGYCGVAFSPDGTRLVTARAYPNHDLWLFDTADGTEVARLKGHANSCFCLRFDPTGAVLATASVDNTVGLWDGRTGALLGRLTGHRGAVWWVTFGPNGRIATASEDKTVRLWTATGEPLVTLYGHEKHVNQVEFGPDGRELYSMSADETVRAWDVAAAERGGQLRGHTSFVYGVAAHPDGRRAVSASWDGTAVLWDTVTGQALRRVTAPAPPGEVNYLNSVAVHPDGRWAAFNSRHDAVYLWDLETGERAHTFAVPTDKPGTTRLALSRDGRTLACGGTDGNAHVFDIATRQPAGTFAGVNGVASAVAFDPTGEVLAVGGRGVRFWNVSGNRPAGEWDTGRGEVNALAYSPDGTTLAAAADDAVYLWDVATGKQTAVLPHGVIVYALAFHPDGRRMVAGCGDGVLRVWDTARWQEVALFRGHEKYVHAVAFSPDGQRLITGSGDSTIRVWDAGPPRR